MKFGGVVDITKIYHQNFFNNFWRQIWIFRAKKLRNLTYFRSKHSNLAPKVLVVDFNNINHRPSLQISWKFDVRTPRNYQIITKISRICQFFWSINSNLAPKIIKKFLVVDFSDIYTERKYLVKFTNYHSKNYYFL